MIALLVGIQLGSLAIITACYVRVLRRYLELQAKHKRLAVPHGMHLLRARLTLTNGERVSLEPVIRITIDGDIDGRFMLPGTDTDMFIEPGATFEFGVLDDL